MRQATERSESMPSKQPTSKLRKQIPGVSENGAAKLDHEAAV